VQAEEKKQKGIKMSIHGKIILRVLLTVVVTGAALFGAGVKLRLSSTEVVEGNALDVQIIAEGKNIVFPDIDNVGGFPVEGSSVSSKLESSYINGTFSSKSLKTLRFSFYPETDMTIPAFKVTIEGKAYQTKPTKIRVIKPSAATAKSANGYTLRMKSNKKHVYVGEPFIVTVDFFEPRNSAVAKVEYTPPQFKGFFSQAQGEEKLTRSAGGTLHQLQYLVSAKQEGNRTIMPPKARVGIRSFSGAGGDPWGIFANDIQWHSVRAMPLKIAVAPVLTNVDMVGLFEVKSSVDHTHVKTNAPVTYTLRISGEGSLDDLADPKFDLPGVTVYGDDAKVTSKVVGEKVVSQYERKYVFISDQDFTIPSLSFKSFDYLSGKSKTLVVKAYKIKVDSAGVAAEKKLSPAKSDSAASMGESPENKTANRKDNRSILEDVAYYKKKREAASRKGYPFWTSILGFVLGSIFTLLIQKILATISQRKNRKKKAYYSTKEALKILYPHTNHHKRVEAMVRKLYEKENGNSTVSIDRKELDRLVNEVLEEE